MSLRKSKNIIYRTAFRLEPEVAFPCSILSLPRLGRSSVCKRSGSSIKTRLFFCDARSKKIGKKNRSRGKVGLFQPSFLNQNGFCKPYLVIQDHRTILLQINIKRQLFKDGNGVLLTKTWDCFPLITRGKGKYLRFRRNLKKGFMSQKKRNSALYC